MTNKISRIFGRFAGHAFPAWIQRFINRMYVRIFDIDLSDFHGVEHYKTLNALFTRALKNKRSFDEDPSIMISPTDSLVTEFGQVCQGRALQIKGMEYSVSQLLGEELGQGYGFINYYLSPRDYHRYHSPCDLEVLEVRYFGGKLLPVNMPSLKKNQNLFIQNERVVIVAKDKNGERFFFVAVGALNVGKMLVHFEPRVQTNAIANQDSNFSYERSIFLKKGQEIGMFEMGSTVVVFGKHLSLDIALGQKVLFGQSIGRF
ncbi:phosphatidylserine decarboxylase [Helicobacter mustelae]|uniref:phosphatidylserine decarboxylase n=1 Tax=Helicobacter mustelae (strain ATCC 43772 / CCUG 25715 / CIP 103759 / LMG 18044 / NCTC 12198 / R85-136P) TaxID=679897 RepID=D3UJ03_HELM1|nr:putative phosphatidylserine decarboxylase [Helicobacter mustelae 12198]SQH71977.1 phosphatidylserine decarboxylase [Helicobacter mustelae]STP13120.1 phosphatidylserine decarboxylase [Helicobacter mustelae]